MENPRLRREYLPALEDGTLIIGRVGGGIGHVRTAIPRYLLHVHMCLETREKNDSRRLPSHENGRDELNRVGRTRGRVYGGVSSRSRRKARGETREHVLGFILPRQHIVIEPLGGPTRDSLKLTSATAHSSARKRLQPTWFAFNNRAD